MSHQTGDPERGCRKKRKIPDPKPETLNHSGDLVSYCVCVVLPLEKSFRVSGSPQWTLFGCSTDTQIHWQGRKTTFAKVSEFRTPQLVVSRGGWDPGTVTRLARPPWRYKRRPFVMVAARFQSTDCLVQVSWSSTFFLLFSQQHIYRVSCSWLPIIMCWLTLTDSHMSHGVFHFSFFFQPKTLLRPVFVESQVNRLDTCAGHKELLQDEFQRVQDHISSRTILGFLQISNQ